MNGRNTHKDLLKTAVIAAVMTASMFLCACAKGDDYITSLDQLDEKGNVITSINQIAEGDTLKSVLKDGVITSKVTSKE